jgi:hypothetical protein
MELILHRRFLGKDYTIGSLYLSHPSPQERGTDAEVIEDNESVQSVPDVTSVPRKNDTAATIIAKNAPLPCGEGLGERSYFCDTLEDVDRGLTQSMSLAEIKRIKIPHETAIPTGVYKVIVNYSQGKKRMLPRLLDVPGFSGILIHRGNTEHDSSGCILVGENKVKGKVVNSTQYEERLVEILTQAQERGEETTITINNEQ